MRSSQWQPCHTLVDASSAQRSGVQEPWAGLSRPVPSLGRLEPSKLGTAAQNAPKPGVMLAHLYGPHLLSQSPRLPLQGLTRLAAPRGPLLTYPGPDLCPPAVLGEDPALHEGGSFAGPATISALGPFKGLGPGCVCWWGGGQADPLLRHAHRPSPGPCGGDGRGRDLESQ